MDVFRGWDSVTTKAEEVVTPESDRFVTKNSKIFMLILMTTFESKDEIFLFLTKLNKKVGNYFLQKYFDVIDRFMPLFHYEKHGFHLKQV
jgi:hypothetical protein